MLITFSLGNCLPAALGSVCFLLTVSNHLSRDLFSIPRPRPLSAGPWPWQPFPFLILGEMLNHKSLEDSVSIVWCFHSGVVQDYTFEELGSSALNFNAFSATLKHRDNLNLKWRDFHRKSCIHRIRKWFWWLSWNGCASLESKLLSVCPRQLATPPILLRSFKVPWFCNRDNL